MRRDRSSHASIAHDSAHFATQRRGGPPPHAQSTRDHLSSSLPAIGATRVRALGQKQLAGSNVQPFSARARQSASKAGSRCATPPSHGGCAGRHTYDESFFDGGASSTQCGAAMHRPADSVSQGPCALAVSFVRASGAASFFAVQARARDNRMLAKLARAFTGRSIAPAALCRAIVVQRSSRARRRASVPSQRLTEP